MLCSKAPILRVGDHSPNGPRKHHAFTRGYFLRKGRARSAPDGLRGPSTQAIGPPDSWSECKVAAVPLGSSLSCKAHEPEETAVE